MTDWIDVNDAKPDKYGIDLKVKLDDGSERTSRYDIKYNSWNCPIKRKVTHWAYPEPPRTQIRSRYEYENDKMGLYGINRR